MLPVTINSQRYAAVFQRLRWRQWRNGLCALWDRSSLRLFIILFVSLLIWFFVFGISEPIGGWIADRFVQSGWDETRTRKTVVTVAFATGLLLIPAARADSAGAAIALIIGGSLVGLATGNLLVILQLCAPPGEIGLWTGIENFAGNLAGIAAPLMTGFLISRTGSYSPGFVLAAVILIAGLLAYWFIVGELKPAV